MLDRARRRRRPLPGDDVPDDHRQRRAAPPAVAQADRRAPRRAAETASSASHRSPSTSDPDEPAGPFATNAFDCVNLIALAAAQAGIGRP